MSLLCLVIRDVFLFWILPTLSISVSVYLLLAPLSPLLPLNVSVLFSLLSLSMLFLLLFSSFYQKDFNVHFSNCFDICHIFTIYIYISLHFFAYIVGCTRIISFIRIIYCIVMKVNDEEKVWWLCILIVVVHTIKAFHTHWYDVIYPSIKYMTQLKSMYSQYSTVLTGPPPQFYEDKVNYLYRCYCIVICSSTSAWHSLINKKCWSNTSLLQTGEKDTHDKDLSFYLNCFNRNLNTCYLPCFIAHKGLWFRESFEMFEPGVKLCKLTLINLFDRVYCILQRKVHKMYDLECNKDIK